MSEEFNNFRNQMKDEDERRKTINEAYDIKMNTVAFTQFCENRLQELDDGCIRQLYIASVKEHYQKFLSGINNKTFDWSDLKIHICSVLININTFLFKYRQRSGYDESKRIKEVSDQIEIVLKDVASAVSLYKVKDRLLKIQILLNKI